MEINRISFNVRESTKNMKMKLNIESKYMLTKQQQQNYSNTHKI